MADTGGAWLSLHEHQLGTPMPFALAGQVTDEHVLVKKGLVVDAATDPA